MYAKEVSKLKLTLFKKKFTGNPSYVTYAKTRNILKEWNHIKQGTAVSPPQKLSSLENAVSKYPFTRVPPRKVLPCLKYWFQLQMKL